MSNNEFEKVIINKNSINANIKPDSKKTRIISYDENKEEFIIEIKAPAEKNKANEELIRFIERISGKKAKIISGKTSKKKIIKLI